MTDDRGEDLRAILEVVVNYCRSHDAYLNQATKRIRVGQINTDAPGASYPEAKKELWKLAKRFGYDKGQALK